MNEGGPSGGIDTAGTQRVSPSVRRQLLTLAKVHGQSDAYYRAALMPVIRKIIVDGSRADVTTKQKRSG